MMGDLAVVRDVEMLWDWWFSWGEVPAVL